MRQSGYTHDESIEHNLESFCYEKDGGFQKHNDQAAELCVEYIKRLGAKPWVVELGCGDGASLTKFQELGIPPLGVDINLEKLSRIKSGSWVNLDMLAYLKGQSTNSIPNIFMHHSLEHIVAVTEVLDEVGRVLMPGGIFFCIVPAEDEPHAVHNTAFDYPEELEPPGVKRLVCEKQFRFNAHEFIYIGVKE